MASQYYTSDTAFNGAFFVATFDEETGEWERESVYFNHKEHAEAFFLECIEEFPDELWHVCRVEDEELAEHSLIDKK